MLRPFSPRKLQLRYFLAVGGASISAAPNPTHNSPELNLRLWPPPKTTPYFINYSTILGTIYVIVINSKSCTIYDFSDGKSGIDSRAFDVDQEVILRKGAAQMWDE